MQSIYLMLLLEAFRMVQFMVRFIASIKLKPVPVRNRTLYTQPHDTSVIVPTIDPGDNFPEAFITWYRNVPREIIIVTTDNYLEEVRRLVKSALQTTRHESSTLIKISSISYASKRRQLAHGIVQAVSRTLVLCDDDTFWPTNLLPHILACFERAEIGGVGTLQKARIPHDRAATVWEHLAAQRLWERNLSITGTNYLDGSVTCLSGRTAAYRTSILKDKVFLQSFTNDLWRGKILIDTGDDTFITRWLYSQGWGIQIQKNASATIETDVADSAIFIKQWLRHTRNSRRSFWRCLFGIPNIWRRYPYLIFIMIDANVRPFIDLWAIYMWVRVFREEPFGMTVFFLFAKIVLKLMKALLLKYEQRRPFTIENFLVSLMSGIAIIPLNLYVYATLDKIVGSMVFSYAVEVTTISPECTWRKMIEWYLSSYIP